jgi:CBS domain-containing protein
MALQTGCHSTLCHKLAVMDSRAMRITTFLRQKGATAAPHETLHQAAARMRSAGLSCLPVVRDEGLVALITERDLVKAMAISARPGEATVADYMRTGSISVEPFDDASVALLRMLAIGCLDLPVVNERRLIGMVSARELLAAQAVVHGIAV